MQFTIVDGESHLDDVRMLFLEYAQQLEIDLSYQDFQAELDLLPGKYARPGGRLFLALAKGVPAACVAMRLLDENRAEMKRLYVRAAFRGQALGRMLANEVINSARELSCQVLLLDTLATMQGAQALYRDLGFFPVAPYYDCPIAGTVFMQLTL